MRWSGRRGLAPPDGARLARRIAWGVACAVALLLLQSILHQPMAWPPILLLAGIVALAATRPFDALLVASALIPLGGVILPALRIDGGSIRFTEALTLAFIAGWTARRAVRPRPLRIAPAVRWSALALVAACAASAIVHGAVAAVEDPGIMVAGVIPEFVAYNYLIHSDPVTFAMALAGGLMLLLAAADICAGSADRLAAVLRGMLYGAAAAAVLNALRIVMLALRAEDSLAALVAYGSTLRVNVHHGDVNAAGSYFAMMLFIAAGIAARAPVTAAVCGAASAAGLWMSGSRAAMGGAFVIAAAAVLVAALKGGRRYTAQIAAGLALLAFVAAGVWMWYPARRNAALEQTVSLRVQLWKAGVQMTAAEPVFGVGLGRFYPVSQHYLPAPENAHNNYLQLAAETGVPGLLLFLSLMTFALREAVRGARDRLTWGLIAGIATFLLTCMAGHPLLVPAAANPFWIAAGLAAASGGGARSSRGWRTAGLLLVALYAASVPFRLQAALRQADVGNVSSGFSQWQREPDGSRYRWAGGRATFHVDSSARAIRIPLRVPRNGPPDLEVRILIGGREADRVRLRAGEDWRTIRLLLRGNPGEAFTRIDLEARRPGEPQPVDEPPTAISGAFVVGRPILEPR